MHTAHLMVLIAAILPFLTVGSAKATTRYDNAKPRSWGTALDGWQARANWAHQNGFEAFPIFAASVILAELNHANPHRVAMLAVAFIVFRLIYTAMYLLNQASLRSVTWALGLACCVWLFILSM